MQTDNRENQLTKDINRMIRTLNAKTLSKTRRRQVEEDIAYKQKKLQEQKKVEALRSDLYIHPRKVLLESRL